MIHLLLALSAHGSPAQLEEAWRAAREGAVWRSPRVAERDRVREGMERLARAAPTCDAALRAEAGELLARADLEIVELDRSVWLVREREERRGGGLFAVRCGEASPWLWQAPHAFFDLDTRAVAQHLFDETGARALALSTVHRFKALPGETRSDPVHPADVTRQPGSLFHAATLGLASGAPEVRVVQLHGFGERGVDAAAIVSTGDRTRPPTEVRDALEPVLGPVRAFGVDTAALGATHNAQGQALSVWPRPRFLHVELSRDARARLAEQAELRAAAVAALAAHPW